MDSEPRWPGRRTRALAPVVSAAVVSVALVSVGLAGCGASHAAGRGPAGGGAPGVPDAGLGAASTSTSAAPPTTVVHLPGLGGGDSGPSVLAVEQRLAALHYDVGTPDGQFGPADTYAVIAFQKVHGLPRTGRATDDVVSALGAGGDPAPLVRGGGAMRVEVDIARQVLFLYQDDALLRILPVSTGSGQRYCVQGQCDVAVTPGGSFRVFRKKIGQDVSKLGVLYNPLYFNGGIAIHGEPDDPPYPASHGCVRIPMGASLWFYNLVPTGTPVYVVGGPNAPVPFHEEAPGPAPSTTFAPQPTTTGPAPTAPSPSTTVVPTSSTTTTLRPPAPTTTTPVLVPATPASTAVH